MLTRMSTMRDFGVYTLGPANFQKADVALVCVSVTKKWCNHRMSAENDQTLFSKGCGSMQGYRIYALEPPSLGPVALEGYAVQEHCTIRMAAKEDASQVLRLVRRQSRHVGAPCAAQGFGLFTGSADFRVLHRVSAGKQGAPDSQFASALQQVVANLGVRDSSGPDSL